MFSIMRRVYRTIGKPLRCSAIEFSDTTGKFSGAPNRKAGPPGNLELPGGPALLRFGDDFRGSVGRHSAAISQINSRT
jgi:hypothetical protein